MASICRVDLAGPIPAAQLDLIQGRFDDVTLRTGAAGNGAGVPSCRPVGGSCPAEPAVERRQRDPLLSAHHSRSAVTGAASDTTIRPPANGE